VGGRHFHALSYVHSVVFGVNIYLENVKVVNKGLSHSAGNYFFRILIAFPLIPFIYQFRTFIVFPPKHVAYLWPTTHTHDVIRTEKKVKWSRYAP
jgi:hypothetical protein